MPLSAVQEVLRLEVEELKKELDALEEELRMTREEATHHEQQVRLDGKGSGARPR